MISSLEIWFDDIWCSYVRSELNICRLIPSNSVPIRIQLDGLGMHTWIDSLQHWPLLHTSPCEFYNMWSSYGNRKSSASPHRSTFSQLHTWIRKNVRTTDVTSSHKELPDHISCTMCWNWASRTPGRLCTEAGQKPGLGSEDLMKVCVLSIALIEVGIRNVILKIMTRFVDSMKMQDVPSTISWSIHVLPRHAHVCRYKLQSSLSTYKRGAMALNEPLQHHSGSLCQQGICGVPWQIVLINAQVQNDVFILLGVLVPNDTSCKSIGELQIL